MAKVEYKGYTAMQACNGHVMIIKNGKMVFHSQNKRKMKKYELRENIDFYLCLIGENEKSSH